MCLDELKNIYLTNGERRLKIICVFVVTEAEIFQCVKILGSFSSRDSLQVMQKYWLLGVVPHNAMHNK